MTDCEREVLDLAIQWVDAKYAVEEALIQRGKRPLHIEGYSSAEWILLDYGDFIVHVFGHASRKFYDLERLWRDAHRIDVSAEA